MLHLLDTSVNHTPFPALFHPLEHRKSHQFNNKSLPSIGTMLNFSLSVESFLPQKSYKQVRETAAAPSMIDMRLSTRVSFQFTCKYTHMQSVNACLHSLQLGDKRRRNSSESKDLQGIRPPVPPHNTHIHVRAQRHTGMQSLLLSPIALVTLPLAVLFVV